MSPSSVVVALKLLAPNDRVRVFGCNLKKGEESRVRCLREDGVGFEACEVTTLQRVKEVLEEVDVEIEGGEGFEDDVVGVLAAWQVRTF